jgi:hypothetical protein
MIQPRIRLQERKMLQLRLLFFDLKSMANTKIDTFDVVPALAREIMQLWPRARPRNSLKSVFRNRENSSIW